MKMPWEIKVTNTDGQVVGVVVFDRLGQMVDVDGGVSVPAAYHLRFNGEDDQPSLLLSYAIRDGRPACVDMRLEGKPDGRDIKRKDFEIVTGRFHEYTEAAFRKVMHNSQRTDSTLTLSSPASDSDARKASKAARNKMTESLKQEVAQIYRDNFDDGPRDAVMARFAVSEPTAARYIQLAREAGYLPKTRKGVKKK